MHGTQAGALRREPELLGWKATADKLTAEMVFPADGVWFAGHFPDFPVLPGVAQMFYFRHFARKAFNGFPDAGKYRRIKFRRLVRPGEKVLLEVERIKRDSMAFKMSVEGSIASCGSVEGCDSVVEGGSLQVEDCALPQSVLADLLPHRPPMTLLADVVAVDEPGVAVAVADVSSESVFFDPVSGGVPACVALEYMAQTMALAVGAERCKQGVALRVGFILGTRCLDVGIPVFDGQQRYVVRAKCAYSDDEFASFDCAMYGPGGDVVAVASLTAFQPPEEAFGNAELVLKGGR